MGCGWDPPRGILSQGTKSHSCWGRYRNRGRAFLLAGLGYKSEETVELGNGVRETGDPKPCLGA